MKQITVWEDDSGTLHRHKYVAEQADAWNAAYRYLKDRVYDVPDNSITDVLNAITDSKTGRKVIEDLLRTSTVITEKMNGL
jgi:hypothetical protein